MLKVVYSSKMQVCLQVLPNPGVAGTALPGVTWYQFWPFNTVMKGSSILLERCMGLWHGKTLQKSSLRLRQTPPKKG